MCRGSELDLDLGSHHGSQEGSAAVSSHEGAEIDEDMAAAAADFTPMTEEKRIFVNEWIAKLGDEGPDDGNQIAVSRHKTQLLQRSILQCCCIDLLQEVVRRMLCCAKFLA